MRDMFMSERKSGVRLICRNTSSVRQGHFAELEIYEISIRIAINMAAVTVTSANL